MAVKKKETFREWSVIESDVQAMADMSCRPSKQKVRANHVFDENQSVKWNREQVESHNAAVAREVKDLNTKKNKRRDELLDETLRCIVHDLNNKIDLKGAREIWDYAYDEGHAYGVHEVFIRLDRLLCLFRDVLGVS